MPHVIVKLWPGKSEQQKARLAEATVKDAMDVLNLGEESVSVAIEDVKPQDWTEEVYEPDIRKNWGNFARNRAVALLKSTSAIDGYGIRHCEFYNGPK